MKTHEWWHFAIWRHAKSDQLDGIQQSYLSQPLLLTEGV
jgi:hypothetical protein